MSSNKHIRELMEQKYGKICFMEEAGIRYIPVEERIKLKGYRKTDEKITYHHLRRKSRGRTSNRREWCIIKEL